MAIYHLTAKIISRGKGQSALAAAAYRSGERLRDEQTGELKEYRGRSERILFTEIMAPANAPEWVRDRNALWNGAEHAEKRRDAQLAREIEVSLPHELTDQQRQWLVKDFAREAFVRAGYVVDIAIHTPDRDGDARNHHAHLMITRRQVGPEGFAATKDWKFDPKQLERWREQWENLTNRHLERHGHEARVDRRSFEARGIEREPSIHLGYAASEIMARGGHSDRVEEYHGVSARNAERAALYSERSGIDRELQGLERAEEAQKARERAETLRRQEIAAQEAARAAQRSTEERTRRDLAAREAIKAAEIARAQPEKPQEAAKPNPMAEAAKGLQQTIQRGVEAEKLLKDVARADNAALAKNDVGKDFATNAKAGADNISAERREKEPGQRQTEWRKENPAPKLPDVQLPKAPLQNAASVAVSASKSGLRVVDKVNNKVLDLVDFVTDFLSGSPTPSLGNDQFQGSEDSVAKWQQLDEYMRFEHIKDIWETIREDIQAGCMLKAEDIKALPRNQLEQIRAFGDDAVKLMAHEADMQAEKYWRGEEPERDWWD